MQTQTFDTAEYLRMPSTLPVLLYEDDGQVCAHALELDAVAYGKTDVEALEALSGVILGQLAAALYFGDPDATTGTTPPELFERYRAARRRVLFQRKPPGSDRAVEVPLPSQEAIASYAAELVVVCPDP